MRTCRSEEPNEHEAYHIRATDDVKLQMQMRSFAYFLFIHREIFKRIVFK
ncbi:hypothetical protein GCM10008022_46430 [Paenibacillus hunanensis]|nr:hypothetical protein GCM10008022_46430 [Paenibacillus hunanensis]